MPKEQYHHGDLKNALIEAATEILSKEGIGALSLRRVASMAGVSHTAPYAHFTDKQALIAAISTEGYRWLYERIDAVVKQYPGDPLRQLIEAAWVYVSFALRYPARFKITLSGVLEKEKEYPDFVEASQKSFGLVVQIVEACQAEGVLRSGPADAMAVSVWSQVHGFASLLLEGQISHTLLDRWTIRKLLVFNLNQITRVEITPYMFPPEESGS